MEPTTIDWAVIAQALVRDLAATSYEVCVGTFDGVRVCVASGEGTITYSHNLGGSDRPTRAAATRLLGLMETVHQELVAASDEYRAFAAGKSFRAELVVFSGQMDFRVADCDADGAITWYETLEA